MLPLSYLKAYTVHCVLAQKKKWEGKGGEEKEGGGREREGKGRKGKQVLLLSSPSFELHQTENQGYISVRNGSSSVLDWAKDRWH